MVVLLELGRRRHAVAHVVFDRVEDEERRERRHEPVRLREAERLGLIGAAVGEAAGDEARGPDPLDEAGRVQVQPGPEHHLAVPQALVPVRALFQAGVALAERLDVDTIATLDERHFRAVRPKHRRAFRIVP